MQIIITAKQSGLSNEDAIAKSGVNSRAFYRWLRDGKQEKLPYSVFYHAFCDAEVSGLNKKLADLRRVS